MSVTVDNWTLSSIYQFDCVVGFNDPHLMIQVKIYANDSESGALNIEILAQKKMMTITLILVIKRTIFYLVKMIKVIISCLAEEKKHCASLVHSENGRSPEQTKTSSWNLRGDDITSALKREMK